MASSGLLNDIKKKPVVLFVVIALHLVLFIMLGVNLTSSEIHKPASSDKKTVKAVVVDSKKIDDESNKIKKSEIEKEKKEKEQQEKVKKKIAEEKKKQEKIKKKLAEEKKQLEAIKKKKAVEKNRLAELKKKNLAEKKRLELEKKKAEEKKRKQKELEAKRKREEEERRKKELAELQERMAEEERLEAEARQAEARNAQLQSLRSQYVRLIEQKVERNWLRPVTSTSAMSCEVVVTQTSLGDVIDVSLKECTNDLAFQRSIERAVRKASPLPPPPAPEVFDREIHFTFRPRN